MRKPRGARMATRASRRLPPTPTKTSTQAPARVGVVTRKQLATLRRTARKQPSVRWNPNPDDVRRSVVQLVLTLVELIRQLLERQAIHRMERRTLTAREVEEVGAALREIERTVRDIGKTFDLTPEDLNIDLGTIKLL